MHNCKLFFLLKFKRFWYFMILFILCNRPAFCNTQLVLQAVSDTVSIDDSLNPATISLMIKKNGNQITWDSSEARKASREIVILDEEGRSLSYENSYSSIKFIGAGMDSTRKIYNLVGFLDRNYSGKKEMILSIFLKSHQKYKTTIILKIPETNLKIFSLMDSLQEKQKKMSNTLSLFGILWTILGSLVIFLSVLFWLNNHKIARLMMQSAERSTTDPSLLREPDEEGKDLSMNDSVHEYFPGIKEKNLAMLQESGALRLKSIKIADLSDDIRKETQEIVAGFDLIDLKLSELEKRGDSETVGKIREIKEIIKSERKINNSIVAGIQMQQSLWDAMVSGLPDFIQEFKETGESLASLQNKSSELYHIARDIKSNSAVLAKIHYDIEKLNKILKDSFSRKLEVDEFYNFMNRGLVITSADNFKKND